MPPKAQRFLSRQTMATTTFEIFRYSDPVPKRVPMHHHEFYELYFFLSGNVQYTVEDRAYLLTPGDLLLIRPKTRHQPLFTGDQKGYERFVLWIHPQFMGTLFFAGHSLEECFAPEFPELIHVESGFRNLLTFQLEQLLSEFRSQDPFAPIAALSYLTQVLIFANRQALRLRAEKKDTWAAPDSVVYYVMAYINEHYREDLTLDHLANQFFTSKYHLSREFQRLMGTSVHRYLLQRRLEMARELMTQGLAPSEVSQRCGFGDYSNFYRAFRKEYQTSPKSFVAEFRSGNP